MRESRSRKIGTISELARVVTRLRRHRSAPTIVLCAGALLFSSLIFAAPRAQAAANDDHTSWPGGTWQPDPATYTMTVDSDIPIRMNDGAVLIANVGYPANPTTGTRAAGTFPVLLTQDPYVAGDQPQSFYVSRGYINAVVQVRGTVDTHGPDGKELVSDMFGPRQVKDGVALVHWASKLSGSNGKVGLDGCSFLGIDQIFTAAALGPHSPVKEILPACASNGYETYMAGGVASQIVGLFGSSLGSTLSGTRNEAVNGAYNKARESQILAGGPQAYNNAYWQQRTTYNVVPNIVKNGIPALLWSGWYPTDGPGSLLEYAEFQNTFDHRASFGPMSPGQRTTGRYQVVIGPWMHGQGLDDSIQLEWYDTWLKNEKTGMTKTTTPMHLYDLQANRWVNTSDYPITNNATALYLRSDSNLSDAKPKSAGSGDLNWGQPTASGTTLTFNAEPVETEQLIAGPIAATLYARSSNRNLDLITTLFDVSPNGQSTQIATGNLLGSMRAVNTTLSWRDEKGLMELPDHPFKANSYATANSLQRYDIELTPTLYSILPGHHLQLVVSTQPPKSACASLLSALTTPLPCLLTAPQRKTLPGGRYHVVWGASTPSSINVPLLPQGTLKTTSSAITPTSNGLSEPLVWSNSASD